MKLVILGGIDTVIIILGWFSQQIMSTVQSFLEVYRHKDWMCALLGVQELVKVLILENFSIIP